MKKLLLILFCCFLSAFRANANESYGKDDSALKKQDKEELQETKQEENIRAVKKNEPVDFRGYFSKYKKTKIKAKTSPKLEHLKTKIQTEEDIEKRKQEFQERKEKELMLLNREYEILDYKP